MPQRSGRPGTGFISLGDWAAANRTGAANLANQLGGRAEEEAMRASGAVDSLTDDMWERTRGATNRYEGLPTTSARAAELAGQAYGGPDSLRDLPGYEGVMGQARRAGQNASRLGDYYGRITALQDLAGRNGGAYTAGMQGLDSALAGGAGAARFNALGRQWGGLLQRAEGAEEDSRAIGQEGRAVSEASQRRYAEAAATLAEREREERQAQLDAETRNNANLDDPGDVDNPVPRNGGRRTLPPGVPPGKKRGGNPLWEGWA